MEAAKSSEALLPYCNTTECHNPKDLNFKLNSDVKTSNLALEFSTHQKFSTVNIRSRSTYVTLSLRGRLLISVEQWKIHVPQCDIVNQK
jgi:hypothetical protein